MGIQTTVNFICNNPVILKHDLKYFYDWDTVAAEANISSFVLPDKDEIVIEQHKDKICIKALSGIMDAKQYEISFVFELWAKKLISGTIEVELISEEGGKEVFLIKPGRVIPMEMVTLPKYLIDYLFGKGTADKLLKQSQKFFANPDQF